MANGIVAIYIGAGSYIAGIPARDMTGEEWAALPPDDQALALALDLYQVATVVDTPAAPVIEPPVTADKEE